MKGVRRILADLFLSFLHWSAESVRSLYSSRKKPLGRQAGAGKVARPYRAFIVAGGAISAMNDCSGEAEGMTSVSQIAALRCE